MPEKEPQIELALGKKVNQGEKFELKPGDEALVLEIINNPVVQKGLAK